MDEAQLQRRLWTPRNIRASLAGWWDAFDLGTITVVSGVVSNWADKSGLGRDLFNSTSGERPTYTAPGRITFDGTDDRLFTSNLAGVSGSEWVLTAVFSSTVKASGPFDWSGIFRAHCPWSDGNIYFDAYTNSGATRVSAAWGGTANVRYVWSFVTSNGRAYQAVRRSGTVVASDSSGASGLTAGGGIIIGNNGGAHNGVFSEIAIYTDTSAAMIERMEGYMSARHNVALAGTHPFRNGPPLI